MRIERADKKTVKVVAEGNVFADRSAGSQTQEPVRENVREVRARPATRKTTTSDSLVSSSATWRKPKRRSVSIVHFAKCDLHQVGYELALGFQRYSDMSYRTFTDGRTWRGEQQHHLIETRPDVALMQDAIEMADVIILSYDHDAAFLHRQNMEDKKLIIYHQTTSFIPDCGEFGMLEGEAGYGRLVSTPNLLTYAETNSAPLTWLPHPINLEETDSLMDAWEKPVGETLRILHSLAVAPGVAVPDFVRIVQQMEQSGDAVQLGLIQPVKRQVSLWMLSQADLYFASYVHGPGPLTVEAMALGIPALAGCDAEQLEYQLKAVGVNDVKSLPWIYVTPETTEEKLRELQDPQVRARWAEKGRAYVEKFHSVPRVVRRLERFCEALEPAKGVIYKSGEMIDEELVWKRKLRMFGAQGEL